MKLEMVSTPTRLVAMWLRPEAGGAFDIREVPRRSPGPDEIEIAVEAASVNPIDVRRAAGYGRRLLSLMGASRFPMTLGNDFAGVVAAVGSGRASGFAIGERVYGVKPPSRDGTHTSHVLVKPAHTRKAPGNRELQDLAALPYSFVTMWLAAAGAGVTRQNAKGKEILVHGAAGGLGTLACRPSDTAWRRRFWPSGHGRCPDAHLLSRLDALACGRSRGGHGRNAPGYRARPRAPDRLSHATLWPAAGRGRSGGEPNRRRSHRPRTMQLTRSRPAARAVVTISSQSSRRSSPSIFHRSGSTPAFWSSRMASTIKRGLTSRS